jgi:methylmalonyl-CoA mutase cobalamin-binding subunit
VCVCVCRLLELMAKAMTPHPQVVVAAFGMNGHDIEYQ